MQIQTNISLKDYSTMRLGGYATHLAHITTEAELTKALALASKNNWNVVMIGGGSNIFWRDEGFDGLVLVNQIKGYEEEQNGEYVHVTAGAGEIWDSIVARTAQRGLSGIENLSLIPGTVGATPVQNVGAYGQEIADTLVQVRAYDRTTQKMVTIPTDQCNLAYRTSRFKTVDHGRFFITSVTLQLRKANPQSPFYPVLQQYIDDHAITAFTPLTIRQAVIAVRTARLPDPKTVANNGSFFANPIVTQAKLHELQATHSQIPHWPVNGGNHKIPAAWLLQETGFKGVHDATTGMATWPQQPLVLVNEHARSTADLITFRQKIMDAVFHTFGIVLEQEPQLL